ncbi:MAG: hypothetical protein ABI759_28710 [Candidatus Solibacter sp.]
MRLVLLLATAAMLIGGSAFGQANKKEVPVQGYEKKDGTYVPPSSRTAPNKTETDNWSAKGNTNPHTGKEGTKTPKK